MFPSFFASAPKGLAALFPADGPPWQALATLKPFLDRDWPHPLLPAAVADGRPLAATIAIHRGEVYDTDLAIEFGDATKGRLVVRHRGRLLEGAAVVMAGAVLVGRRIHLGGGSLVEAGALIREPTVIGGQTEVRQGAYIRGYCITGQGCVVGHATEVKHSIFLDRAKAGHFAYIGDSILGNDVNLGAGTKLANLRFLPGPIVIRTPKGPQETGLRKLGAILGDGVQTGCNAVTSPGTLLPPGSLLFPNTTAPSGLHPPRARIRCQEPGSPCGP